MKYEILAQETKTAKMLKACNPDFSAIPEKATNLAAGFDLFSCHPFSISIPPGESFKFGTGIKLNMQGLAAWLLPTSGTRDYRLKNTIGLVDPDYHGELIFNLRNSTSEPMVIAPMEKIGQIVFFEPLNAYFTPVEELETNSERGEKGFGQATKQNSKVSALADPKLDVILRRESSTFLYKLRDTIPDFQLGTCSITPRIYRVDKKGFKDRTGILITLNKGLLTLMSDKDEVEKVIFVGDKLEEKLLEMYKEVFES